MPSELVVRIRRPARHHHPCGRDRRQLVGVAVLDGTTLERLFIAPGSWGKGIGTLLHNAVVGLVRERGSTQCDLWVLEQNHQARRFYENRGGTLDGRTTQAQFPPFPPAVGYTLRFR